MYKGTIRSVNCEKDNRHFVGEICFECRSILGLKSFEMRVRRNTSLSETTTTIKGTDGTNNCVFRRARNSYLTSEQKTSKLTVMRAKFRAQRLVNIRLAKRLAQVRARKQKLTQKIGENSKRGDVGAIIYNLNRAYEKGCLSSTSNTLKFMKDITANLSKSAKGRRYDKFTKGYMMPFV